MPSQVTAKHNHGVQKETKFDFKKILKLSTAIQTPSMRPFLLSVLMLLPLGSAIKLCCCCVEGGLDGKHGIDGGDLKVLSANSFQGVFLKKILTPFHFA